MRLAQEKPDRFSQINALTTINSDLLIYLFNIQISTCMKGTELSQPK